MNADVKVLDAIQKLKADKFKMPSKVGDAIDLLYQVREIRLAAQKEVDMAQEGETKIATYVQNCFDASGLESAKGNLASFSKTKKIVYKIVDWAKTKAWLKKTGQLEVLQQRVTPTVCQELWDDKKPVPGIDRMEIPGYSLNKATR